MIITRNTDTNTNNTVNLTKGQAINLTKKRPSLKEVTLGLGWDTPRYKGVAPFDLDASIFAVNSNGTTKPEGFVFYHNLEAFDKAIVHTGDNITGEGEGDDEQIIINFGKLPEDIVRIAVVVTIDSAKERKQTFGLVDNAFFRIVNNDNGEEEVRYDLNEEFYSETAIVVGEFYKTGNEWSFKAMGTGFDDEQGGLVAICAQYGLKAAYM